MQGNNILITIKREQAQTDNDVGGRRYVLATIAEHVQARLSADRPNADLRAQGIQIGKTFSLVLQPVDREIQERDIITPETGAWGNQNFRVTGVQVDSISPSNSRGHLSIGLSRMEDARDVQ